MKRYNKCVCMLRIHIITGICKISCRKFCCASEKNLKEFKKEKNGKNKGLRA